MRRDLVQDLAAAYARVQRPARFDITYTKAVKVRFCAQDARGNMEACGGAAPPSLQTAHCPANLAIFGHACRCF